MFTTTPMRPHKERAASPSAARPSISCNHYPVLAFYQTNHVIIFMCSFFSGASLCIKK